MTRARPIILSVDDDAEFQATLKAVLEHFGVILRNVATPEAFTEALGALNPDLCLIDLQLGQANGLDLIRSMRSSESYKRTAIVVVSGSDHPANIVDAMELGADDFLLKPLDRVLLASKLSQFIETPEMKGHGAAWKELSQGAAQIRLTFNGVIEGVDELGIRFTSATLAPKGSVLRLDSAIFDVMGTLQKGCLVTVISNWLIPETQRYGAYAEFDGVEPEFLQAVRQWLAQPRPDSDSGTHSS